MRSNRGTPTLSPREEIETSFAELRNAERLLGQKLHIAEGAQPEQVMAALTEINAKRPDALIITDGLALKLRPIVMEFAVKKRLPTSTNVAWTVKIKPYHPLLGYGSRFSELTRKAAYHVDKILKGAKPGDLPIQQAGKFELAVNLKTAAANWADVATVAPCSRRRGDRVVTRLWAASVQAP